MSKLSSVSDINMLPVSVVQLETFASACGPRPQTLTKRTENSQGGKRRSSTTTELTVHTGVSTGGLRPPVLTQQAYSMKHGKKKSTSVQSKESGCVSTDGLRPSVLAQQEQHVNSETGDSQEEELGAGSFEASSSSSYHNEDLRDKGALCTINTRQKRKLGESDIGEDWDEENDVLPIA